MPQTVIVFRKPILMTDKLLSYVAGKLVHCDIMPVDSKTAENSMNFTSYVGERFSASITGKRLYNNNDHMALCIEISEEEQDAMVSYLYELCENNIPYNYADLAAEMLPSQLAKFVVDEISSDDPKQITNLFCSQAVVLVLRNSLDEKSELCKRLKHQNCRLTLPYELYTILKPFSTQVCCNALRRGEIVSLSD
jgi:hypothetical protein